MALALADSIAERGWDLHDQAERYVAWWKTGVYSVTGRAFDIGVTTASSLSRFAASATSACRVTSRLSPAATDRSCGSPRWRLRAPVSARERASGRARLIESGLPTHASPQCLSACAYMGVVLAGLLNGLAREEVFDAAFAGTHLTAHRLHPEIEEVALGTCRRRPPVGSSYVVRSLEAALWAFHDAADFREAVLRAVNLGDDADTTERCAVSWPGRTSESRGYRRSGATDCAVAPSSIRFWRGC